jgi:hypothetical protein
MLLVIPPADVIEAPSRVAVKVWTRDSAASNRMHPAGFRSGTTRNSIGALTVDGGGVGAGAVVDDWVAHPAITAEDTARPYNKTAIELRIGHLPLVASGHGNTSRSQNLTLKPMIGP